MSRLLSNRLYNFCRCAGLIIFLSLSLPLFSQGRPVSIKAKVHPEVLMGAVDTLTLEVVEEIGAKGHLPLLKDLPAFSYRPICKDSVEIRGIISSDTLELGSGRRQLTIKVGLQAFNPGRFELPKWEYVAGTDTVSSANLVINVLPVDVSEDENIYDYADVAKPDADKLLDSLPDAIYYNWYWWLLAIILVAILIWLFIQFKQTGYFIKPKRVPTPYEVAVKQLQKLKKRKLWEEGRHKEYYTQLTDILRNYLQARFGINAMEMTSAQIIEALKENPDSQANASILDEMLHTSDFVKFAKVNPEAEENIRSFDSAATFLEVTKPMEKEEEDHEEQSKGGKKNKRKGGKK